MKSLRVGGRIQNSSRAALQPLLVQCGGSQLDDEGFRTLMVEVENIVNSRPAILDHLSDSNFFGSINTKQSSDHEIKISSADSNQSCIAVDDGVVSTLLMNFGAEYLHNLQNRRKWCEPQPNMKSGDVVLILDENAPRNDWKLARVIEVTPGEDGRVRKVKVVLAQPNLDDN